jgi:hypothetical protein
MNENDTLNALWTSAVFDMSRVGVFDMFADNKRYDGKFYTDGISITFQFTRPSPPSGPVPALCPQLVGELPGDSFRFVDPGRTNCFTSVDSLSNDPANPPVVRSFSAAEYYHCSGLDVLETARYEAKRKHQMANDERETPELGIIQMESTLPRRRATTSADFLAYVNGLRPILPALQSFYSKRFNRWNFYGYRAKQLAYNEMARTLTWGSRKHQQLQNVERHARSGRRLDRFPKAAIPPEPEPPDGRRILVFGDGVFPSSVKGRRAAPTVKLYKKLKLVSKNLGNVLYLMIGVFPEDHPLAGQQRLLVLKVNENFTSKVKLVILIYRLDH